MQKALEILNSFINYEKIGTVPRDLDRFIEFLNSLGAPHRKLKNVIHIVGTKGKGSVAYHLSHALIESGYRVGTFTSPHLMDVRERIMLDLKPISPDDFESFFFRVYERMSSPAKNFRTYFETLTAMAILYFREMDVDFAIFEAGLGGRLDATNVFPHPLTIITPIDYDHTHVLGNSLSEIAREKAWVMRPDGIAITAPQPPEAMEVIREIALSRSVSLHVSECRPIETSIGGTSFIHDGKTYTTPAVGLFQGCNASLALSVLDLMGIGYGEDVFSGLKIPGRFHIHRWNGKTIVMDIAHNALSIKMLMETMRKVFPVGEYAMLLSIVRDKDIEKITRFLSGEYVIATRSSSPRSASPHRICRYLKNCVAVDSLDDALERILHSEYEIVLITGSTYLVGDVMEKMDLMTW